MALIANYGWTFPQKINAKGFMEFTDDIVTLVKHSIYQILGTRIGERVNEPEFGSRLWELMFEPLDEIVIPLARLYTIQAIERWEPRARRNEISAILNADQNRYEIYGSYVVANTGIVDQFAVSFPKLITGGG